MVDGLKPHVPPLSNQKNEMLIFGLHSTSDDRPGWSMDSNPSATSLQPKNEMPIFGLCSTSDNWLGWSMDSNPSGDPSPAKKMKCLFLDYVQLLMIGRAGHWTRTPSATSSQAKKMNAYFWITFQLLMISRAGWWTQTPSATPLQPKNEVLIFGLCSTSDDWPGWSMDSNPICHLCPAKEWNAHFWITFNFWWSAGLVIGLEPHPPPLSRQKKWNAHFWITFNFWWLAGLVDGFKPHPPPASSQKIKWLFFDYFQFLASARLVNGLKPHPQPFSSQKSEMLIFGLRSTSDD